MTGRRRGPCAVGFGAETIPKFKTVIHAERGANPLELSLWEKAENAKNRVVLLSYLVSLQYQQIIVAAQIAKKYGVDIGADQMAQLEPQMMTFAAETDQLRQDHCEVNGLNYGVRLSSSGDDLDIIAPPNDMGALWIPIAIGAVVIAGIIARWIFLEKTQQEISDKYNGILHLANQRLCSDPDSPECKEWTTAKSSAAYQKNDTLIDSVKTAVSKVGGAVSKGLGAGIMLAIPLLMILYLPRKKGS